MESPDSPAGQQSLLNEGFEEGGAVFQWERQGRDFQTEETVDRKA